MRRWLTVAALGALGCTAVVGVASSEGPRQPLRPQALAQHLLGSRNAPFLSAPAQRALAVLASGDRAALPTADLSALRRTARPAGKVPALGPGLRNVRANNPAQDRFEVDQTTQSEPSIAVSGKNVVVGYNDSQQALPAALTAGLDLDGYSSSSDGGATFTDRGTVPNLPGLVNLGDPWLAADRNGGFYYASLAFDAFTPALVVAVSKSKDGGKTWARQTVASPSGNSFYFADKDALTVGPDPADASRDVVYATWSDQFTDPDGIFQSGLPVARSVDSGRTWETTYADLLPVDPDSCSFTQYLGAVPAVAADGTLYVAAEKATVDDPDCTGENPFVLSEVVFTSKDGGQSFDSGTQLAEVTGVDYLDLGPGSIMRNLEFPSIAVGPDGHVHVAWNDSELTDDERGPARIRLATSTDGGETWDTSWVTDGTADAVQPAISADAAGVHVLYYLRTGDATLDVVVADSNGSSWSTRRISSTAFPGALTAPQFDPQTADGYMGDYIANASDGKHRYFAWGDNRDVVKNFMYPGGRPDPNVYVAKQ